jgi:hypothetical protein
MSLIVEALQPALLRGVFATAGPYPDQSLSDVFASTRSTYLATSDSATRSIALAFPTYADVTHAVVTDCRRLSVSWLQSTLECWPATDDKLAIPWSLVRLYYSAFYASHVLVRLLGRACCWLDASQLARIDSVHRAVTGASVPFRVDPGSYLCAIDHPGTEFTLTRLSASSRGAHEALWAAVEVAIRDRTPIILSGAVPTRDAQLVIAKLDEFRALSTQNGSIAWLSKVRNAIQYRMEHSVWHPTHVGVRERRELAKMVADWQTDPMSFDLATTRARPLLMQFAAACTFLIALCRAFLSRIESASVDRQRSFVRHGAWALANVQKVKMA